MTAGVILEKMPPAERYTFVAGIVEGLAHARFVRDNKETEARSCTCGWFYEDKATIRKIEEAFQRYPGALPGAVVGALVSVTCGV